MKGLRLVLGIERTQKKINELVLEKAGTQAQLRETMEVRNPSHFVGPIAGRSGDCPEK